MKEKKTQFVLEEEFFNHLESERPTGIVAVNYDVAEFLQCSIYNRLKQGRLIPKFINKIDIASFCHNLQSIHSPYISYLAMQPGVALGEKAAEILVERLSKNSHYDSHQIVLPMDVVDLHRFSEGV